MKQLETDVVVVAAGLSGLAASVAAAEAGARVITLEKAPITGGAANMGMGPAAAGSPLQKGSMIEVTPGELFRRHMFYTHYQVDARLVRDYYFKSGDTIAWLQDMGVVFNSVRPAFRARERTRAYGVTARDKDGEEYEISCKSVIVATGGFGHNAKLIQEKLGFEWGRDLFSFAIPGMDGDGINMCHEVGGGHTPVTMELMYQIPDNMNHFYVEGAFRQPCYWCNRLGERFMPEDEIYNTTFVGNAINHLPGKVAYAIFDSRMLKHWKKDGPDIVSHVHPHDLYEGFDEQWERDLAAGYPAICQADTLEELAEKAGIDVEGLLANVDEYNEMCDNGWDDIFEKEREFMRPLEKGPFYCCKQYCGAYGTLGGVLINHKMEVMTDDYEVIPGLYCVGTDACTIYGDSYNYCIPGNTMGFCLNSGRIAGENAASALFEDAGDEEWS